MTFDLDLWPTDLKINRDHLLTKDYLPTKFEASEAKRYIELSVAQGEGLPTYRQFIHTITCRFWKSILTISLNFMYKCLNLRGMDKTLVQ